jgi:hypothetical protein
VNFAREEEKGMNAKIQSLTRFSVSLSRPDPITVQALGLTLKEIRLA